MQKVTPKQSTSSTNITTNNIDPGTGATNIVVTRNLWSRGPIQVTGSTSTNAGENLNSLSRQSVPLYDLSSATGTLSGPRLSVFYSESGDGGDGRKSPSLSTFTSSKAIAWDSPEFKSFMLFAHGSRAFRYMRELYPSITYQVRTKSIFPMEAYSNVPDSPLMTRYRVNTSGKPGNVMFYQDPDGEVPYNPVDESDAIYHEFGHVLQHILNPTVLETFGNYDIDTLLEALADFYAASAVRDDQILLYLRSNAPLVFSENNRTGIQHDRKLGGSLYFPKDYVGDFHLDARIVSNALNDIRKFLQGSTVNLLQDCSSPCTVQWSGAQNYFNSFNTTAKQAELKALSFDKANVLAHDALRQLVANSTLVHFSDRLIAVAKAQSWKTQCGSSATCIAQVESGVRSILKSRGIYTSKPIRCTSSTCREFATDDPDDDSDNSQTQELLLNNDGNLRFFPLFNASNNDTTNGSKVDPCESIIAYPDIKLSSSVQASVYDVLFELNEVSRFSSLKDIDLLSKHGDFYDTSEPEIKLWGFLLPGESIVNLVGNLSSRFYQSTNMNHQSSMLSPSPYAISSDKPLPLGWALRAPSSGVASVNFAFSARPFEVLYAPASLYTNFFVTQKLTVSGSQNFCSTSP